MFAQQRKSANEAKKSGFNFWETFEEWPATMHQTLVILKMWLKMNQLKYLSYFSSDDRWRDQP